MISEKSNCFFQNLWKIINQKLPELSKNIKTNYLIFRIFSSAKNSKTDFFLKHISKICVDRNFSENGEIEWLQCLGD